MVQNSVLRENARKQLGNNIFAKNWLLVMVACLIYSAILSISGTTVIIALVLAGSMAYGLCRLTVNRVKEQGEVDFADLFKGFTDNFTQSFLLGLLQSLFVFLWSLLFVIPGIIKAYSYSMAFYIMQDDPSKDWKTCLDESKAMMDGHKWQLFCLDLSFIGWMILGVLCCGIGTIFVIPYQYTAHANFYMALKASVANVADDTSEAESV